jgi:hypothetical protein
MSHPLAAFPTSGPAHPRSVSPPPPRTTVLAPPTSNGPRAAAAGGGRGWADEDASLTSLNTSALSVPLAGPSLYAAPVVRSSPAPQALHSDPRSRAGAAGAGAGLARPDSRLEQLEVQLAAVEMGDSLRGRTRTDKEAPAGFASDVPSLVGRPAAGPTKLMRM